MADTKLTFAADSQSATHWEVLDWRGWHVGRIRLAGTGKCVAHLESSFDRAMLADLDAFMEQLEAKGKTDG